MINKNKKTKPFKKVIISLFITSLIVLFVLIYCIPNVGETFQKTRIATYDTIQIIDNLECYIIRDETVFFSNTEGTIKYIASEGERVRKSSEILRVHVHDIDPTAESKLEVLNQRIEKINNGESIFENDLNKIEEKIASYAEDIRKATDEGNISEIKEFEEKILRLTEKKNIIMNNTGLKNDNIEALEQERNHLQSTISQSIVTFKSSEPGVISYYIDGYETELTPANMYLLNKEELDKIEIEVQNTFREKTLSNEPLFKMIHSSVWYVAAWVDDDKIDNYIKGNTVYLNLPNGQTKGVIYDIIVDEEKNLVLIKMNHYYPDYWQIRKINTEIIVANYEGLKIDNDSIIEVDGRLGVYVVNIDGEYTFMPIKVIGTDGKRTIVENGFFYVQADMGSEKVKTIDLYDEILRKVASKTES